MRSLLKQIPIFENFSDDDLAYLQKISTVKTFDKNRFQANLFYIEKQFKDALSQIKLKIDTYKNKELPDDLKKIQPTKPGSRNL